MLYPWSVLKLWLILSSGMLIRSNSSAPQAQVKESTCSNTCGGVQIHYPFGIGKSCSLSDKFIIICSRSDPRPLIGDMEITSIDLESSQVHAKMGMSYKCYHSDGPIEIIDWNNGIKLETNPFQISYEENIFIAVGCDTLAYIYDSAENYIGGCISWCRDTKDIINGSCSGTSCCQSSVPRGVRSYKVSFESWKNHSYILDFNPCSYGFIVKKGSYNFSTFDLRYMDPKMKFPLILDWVVENLTCLEAKRNMKAYGCVAQNSKCHDSTNGLGYVCKCSKGYRGNPYLQNGCKDIDECKERLIRCKGECVNTQGSYTCTCPHGTTGNATGDGCVRGNINGFSTLPKLGLGIGIGLPFLFVVGSWIFWVIQKRNLTKLKEDFFRQNGGLFLQEQMSSNHINTFTIFTTTEMEKATNRFDEQRILGRGGNGIVYKGLLQDGRTVAIKKSMMVEASKHKEFANEMLILSQVNHVNVVKLLGCCLEVEVPILVYEYIANGTLHDLIHDKSQDHLIPWKFRLKIGTESAKALTYLHSEASPPILHGDIKSANILLDDQYITKVSDFGTSTLAPKDKSRFMTLIQGTYGYLDPRYLETGELTQKSDVYSFGVVMVELLTRKKAIYKDEFYREKNLVFEFKSCMKEGKLLEILDPQLKDVEASSSCMEEINVVASLALRCLSVTREERPTMSEVLRVLDVLKGTEEMIFLPDLKHQSIKNEFPSTKSEIMTNKGLSHIGRGR